MALLEFKNLTGPDKAAILLLILGEEQTAKVFDDLTDREVRMISRSMLNLDHIPAEVAKNVLTEYQNTVMTGVGVYFEGDEFVKKTISSATDKKRLKNLINQVSAGKESKALESLSMMQPRIVSSLLRNEHPQTLALILSTQKADHAAQILSFFPPDLRADIIYRISKIEEVSYDVLKQIEEALEREIGGISQEQQRIGGVDTVVELLSRLDRSAERNVMSYLEEVDPDVAEEIRSKMFSFEDLADLDDRSMQSLLKEVTTETLIIALKSTTEELKRLILSNLSKRAAQMIQEDMETMGPVKLSEVESMQQAIVQVALKLEDDGTIVLPGRGGEGGDVLV